MIKIKLNTSFALYAYWAVIIIWQTVRPVENRSAVDVLVKMGCFVALCIYGFNRQDLKNTKRIIICTILFLMTQSVTYAMDTLNASSLITAVFMFAQILVFMIFLKNAVITTDELCKLADAAVISAMIMCIYNVLFNTNRFLRLFTASAGAYGSECSSFLYSNHEFAVYIVAAIVFTLWRLINGSYKKLPSFVMLAFLLINLLSTYSRTAILGGVAAIVILIFYYNIKYFGVLCGAIAVASAVVIGNERLNNFVLNKVFKGSFAASGGVLDEGRELMYIEEMEFFRSGSIVQKLFGHGYVGGATGGHNAYLYILNIGGIIMFAFFLLVIAWSFVNSFRIIKHDRSVGSLCLGLQVFACLYMVAQTPILFFSTMDSYFITMIAVLIPMYSLNYVKDRVGEKKAVPFEGIL